MRVALRRVAHSPRFWLYLIATAAVVAISWLLGKEMRWDTLDYHFYAGFSALHDRFSEDYFAAGPQSYFNPYVYAPFYLLATSGLSALAVASILAVVQSAILWLTYEIALEVSPMRDGQARQLLAICAAVLTLCNPILINQFGSSYADVLTAEIVLCGWLLLVRAIRAPSALRVVCAALLLGAASALKATNSVHAVSAGILSLFLPARWRGKFGYAAVFGLGFAVALAGISAPWSIRLEQHFGNPVFPLFNGIFHSPQFPTARNMDYRFVPDSLADALWRPFAIATPNFTVDDEVEAPDLRYAIVLLAGAVVLLRWGWRRLGRSRPSAASMDQSLSARTLPTRVLSALGSAFLVDWILWLTASGNGRYFIAGACVAGILAVAMIFRLCAGNAKLRTYVLVAIFAAQLFQLYAGTYYRHEAVWDGRAWFQVRVPKALASRPALYLSYGIQSNSFIVPFLAPGAGFIGLAGQYPLGPTGANGAKVAELIGRYAPNLELITPETSQGGEPPPTVSLSNANAALLAFGLRAEADHCETIVVRDEGPQGWAFKPAEPPAALAHPALAARTGPRVAADPNTGYLAACRIIPDHSDHSAMLSGERIASRALDRLEDACPSVFQPRRPITQYYGQSHHSDIWARRYMNTDLTAWVSNGWVKFLDPLRGGSVSYIGPERAFAGKELLRIACGRRHDRYYAKLLSPSR